MWETIKGWFTNPYFYLILFGLGTIAYNVIKPYVKRLPFVNKRTLMLVGLGGLLITSGILGANIGSVSKSPSGVLITDLQVTTSFSGNCTVAANNNVDDLIDVRCTDANVDEGAGSEELDTGVITVTRGGNLDPMSCPVIANTQRGYQSESTPGDGNLYTITEVTSLNELEVYLVGASSSTAATTSSAKEKTYLAFADGVATGYVGVAIEVDETAHDELAQYSYKDVVVSICGKPFTFRIHRMD